MPDVAQELHAGRVEWVVLGELELGWEDATFEGSAVRPLDQGFPEEDIIFGNWSGSDPVGGGGGKGAVFVEKAAGREGGCHGRWCRKAVHGDWPDGVEG